jgi:hypothetical protein
MDQNRQGNSLGCDTNSLFSSMISKPISILWILFVFLFIAFEGNASASKLPISVLVLAWKSPVTLDYSLSTYNSSSLFHFVSEVIIFFQEINEKKIKSVQEYGYPIKVIGSENNTFISGGLQKLVEAATYPYILFLELDFYIDERFYGKNEVYNEMLNAYRILESNLSDIYFMRSRTNAGKPNYAEGSFRGNEMKHISDNGTHVCTYHFWIKNPVEEFPTLFSYCDNNRTRSFCISSRYCSWTNNPYIIKKDFFLKNLSPALDSIRQFTKNSTNSKQYKEYNLVENWFLDYKSYWIEKDYVCAMGEGLFSHLHQKT